MEYDYGVSKRITETKSAIIFCAVILVVATILLISTFKPSVNISKEFLLYNELKNIKDSATLVETLKDKQIAFDCYQQSNKIDNTVSLKSLGRCYLHGIGTKIDLWGVRADA